MKNYRKPLNLMTAFVLFTLGLISSGFAQSNLSDLPLDKPFAHLHKTIFVAGETIFFNLMVYSENQPSPSKIAYAEVINRDGEAFAQEIISLKNGSNQGHLVLPENLPSDHYLVRMYTRMSRPGSGEGSVFHQFVTVINPQKPPVMDRRPARLSQNLATNQQKSVSKIHLTQEVYKSRDSIHVKLNDSDKFLGVSVSLQNPFLTDAYSEPLRMPVYSPRKDETQIIPEIYGHIIKGKKMDGNVTEEESFFLSAHGKQSMLFTAKANPHGEVFFDLGAFQDYDFVIAQSSNWEDPFNFIIEYPFIAADFHSEFNFPKLVIDETYSAFLNDLVISKETTRYMEPDQVKTYKEVVTGFSADNSYLLDDYNRFEDFATTLREYVPEVFVRRQDKKTIYRVFNKPYNILFKGLPLMLIDAMPVFDSDALAKFEPKSIKQLEVVARDFYINKDVFNGVVSLTSYQNDFGGFPLPNNALYITYKGPQKLRIPAPLKPAKINDRFFPDFRSVLYWNPDAVDNKNIHIKASEISGNFTIRASYISGEGQLEWEEKTIQITPKSGLGMQK